MIFKDIIQRKLAKLKSGNINFFDFLLLNLIANFDKTSKYKVKLEIFKYLLSKNYDKEVIIKKLKKFIESLSTSNYLEEKIESLILLTKIYHYLAEFKEALLYSDLALDIAKNSNNLYYYYYALLYKIHVISHINPKKSIELLKEIDKKVIEELGLEYLYNLTLANSLFKYGEFNKSLEAYMNLLNNIKEINKEFYIHTLNKVGRCKMFLNHKDFYDYFSKSQEEIYKGEIFKVFRFRPKLFKNQEAELHFYLHEYYLYNFNEKLADKHIRSALFLARESKFYWLLPYIYIAIARLFRILEINVNIFNILYEAKKLFEKFNIFNGIYYYKLELSLNYINQGKIREGIRVLKNLLYDLELESRVEYLLIFKNINDLVDSLSENYYNLSKMREIVKEFKYYIHLV